MTATAAPPGVRPLITETRSPLSVTPGIGSSRVELIQLKIVLLAAMPRARTSTAVAVKPGDEISDRKP